MLGSKGSGGGRGENGGVRGKEGGMEVVGKSRHWDSNSERACDLPKSHSILLGRCEGQGTLGGGHSMPNQEGVTLQP